MKNDVIIISTTFENVKDAKRISKKLLKDRLVACCQIGSSITSYYTWKGEMQKSEEIVLTLKTIKKNGKKVCKKINKYHPYDTPEIISIKTSFVGNKYTNWIKEVTR